METQSSHDFCYSSYFSKSECDFKYHVDLLKECPIIVPIPVFVSFPIGLVTIETSCQVMALLLYIQVTLFGFGQSSDAKIDQVAHENSGDCGKISKPPGFLSGVFGDPHLSTFDRLRFDCQAAGEFVTVTSLETPEFIIQERFTSVQSDVCSLASVSTGVALQDVNTPTVQVSISNTLTTDNIQFTLPGNSYQF